MSSTERVNEIVSREIRSGKTSGTVVVDGHRWRFVGELVGQTVWVRLCRPVNKRLKFA